MRRERKDTPGLRKEGRPGVTEGWVPSLGQQEPSRCRQGRKDAQARKCRRAMMVGAPDGSGEPVPLRLAPCAAAQGTCMTPLALAQLWLSTGTWFRHLKGESWGNHRLTLGGKE